MTVVQLFQPNCHSLLSYTLPHPVRVRRGPHSIRWSSQIWIWPTNVSRLLLERLCRILKDSGENYSRVL